MFTIYNDSGSDSTMVSNLFIDEYMKSANDAQIKVYLYLLRMMGAHRAASVSEMADQFNHTEKDVVRSLRYWEQKGLLNLDFDSRHTLVSIRLCRPGTLPGMVSGSSTAADAGRVLSFSQPAGNLLTGTEGDNSCLRMAAGGVYRAQTSMPLNAPAVPSSEQPVEAGTAGTVSAATPGTVSPAGRTERPAPSELEALENFRSSTDRAKLLFVIEQYIGKPLSLNEIRIIYHISEQLHFSDDMIDYLLQYCVDRGKKDFRYIRKVAENWSESGIFTPLQAEQAAARESLSARKKKVQETGSSNSSDSAAAGAGGAAPYASPSSPDGADSGRRSAGKKSGRAGRQTRSANSFNQFEQNNYDFDALERELLES